MNNNYYNGQVNNVPVGSITINREKNALGCLFPFDIYIDNMLVANVTNGKSVQIPVYYGSHLLELKQGLNEGSLQIMINDQQKNLVFNCTMKMGLITNTIAINLINYYN